MKNPANVVIRRGDYTPPAAWIPRVELSFELAPQLTRVVAQLHLRRNESADAAKALVLYGEQLQLESLDLDGVTLSNSQYVINDKQLVLSADIVARLRADSRLTITTSFNPSTNFALEGLYVTGDTFCTQCEAEGFRRITYFPDRPDVLSEYTVTLRADKAQYPVLLSNGNLVSQRDLPGGRHEAVWHDPFNKPCYLFALVAGNIDRIQDHFVTASGRKVLLEIYSTTPNLPRCTWAMECLKASMKWDEEAYGREYDLDRFMIYAADDFNMGAMENKGLNIFNSRYLLADPETATDADFQLVDAIVAHEYFHNWSGNRVTCRDWFQISLKEGFTVFREQQYSAYRGSPAVTRIEEAATMQARQFPQDAGPMAHPIRPDEYEAIDNFYTVTVYEKGAEVIRMLHTLLGASAYRKGSDLYFERHDGTAATCDDFVQAMADASGQDLSEFKRWYSQAGTPSLSVSDSYDPANQRYHLTVKQTTPATPGQPTKLPVVIPLSIALLDGDNQLQAKSILTVNQAEQSFNFEGVTNKPVPSLLRSFSAPVKVDYRYSDDDLARLVAHDDDGVVRWQSLRTLFYRAFDALANGSSVPPALNHALESLLDDRNSDPALLAHLLNFPSRNELADRLNEIFPQDLGRFYDDLLRYISKQHAPALLLRYQIERAALAEINNGKYSLDARAIAHRALANAVLLLANVDYRGDGGPAAQQLVLQQWQTADNLTDALGAMTALRDVDNSSVRNSIYGEFHDRWQDDLSMLNRWFMLEASKQQANAAAYAGELMRHPKFDPKNPNRVRSVVFSFCDSNWSGFHAADGSGYQFAAEQILRFDAQNPSLAARFCAAFARWHAFEPRSRAQQEKALKRIAAESKLSANVREIIEKTLKAGGALSS